jgi:uncharacterized protein (TIGR03435 family)
MSRRTVFSLSAILVSTVLVANTQTPKAGAQRPAFEVESVKPNASNAPANSRFALGPGDAYAPGGLFLATNQPLIVYLRFAYRLGQSDLLGLPAWVYDDRFDVEARAPGSATKDEMRLMMQGLLADRFELATHTERRTKPVFNLVLSKAGKTGPQLRPHVDDEECSSASASTTPSATLRGTRSASPTSALRLPPISCGRIGPVSASAPNRGRLVGRGVTMARVASVLMNPFTGVERPVRDRTALTGTFDLSVEWTLPSDPTEPVQSGDTGSTFLEALQEQLGLKLKAANGPVDVLVIDHVEQPTPD